MPPVFLPDLRLNADVTGPADGAPLVLVHALGTSMAIWDSVAPGAACRKASLKPKPMT